jgi:hypothetical protein
MVNVSARDSRDDCPFSENDVAPFAPKSICTLWRVILCVALVIVVAVWAGWRWGN